MDLYKKLERLEGVFEVFLSDVPIEKLLKTVSARLGKVLEASGVVFSLILEDGISISGSWGRGGKGFKKRTVKLKQDNELLGTLELHFEDEQKLSEVRRLISFLSRVLPLYVRQYLERAELKKRLRFFHLFFNLSNLFRKTSEFRKRVELSLWALCDSGDGFGFNEAAYFVFDEASGRLKGLLYLSQDRIGCEGGVFPTDACVFTDFPREIDPGNLEFGAFDGDFGFDSEFVFAVPLFIENRLLGSFFVGMNAEPDDVTREMLLLFAQEVALAFESAKLQEALKRTVNELKEARERFSEVEKLKTLGEFLARTVHDIKNPLVAVSGLARRLYEKLPEDYPEKAVLKVIVDETNRALSILTDVLSYVRQPVLRRDLFDINDVIDEIIFMESATLRDRRIVLYKNLDRSIPKIKGDSAQIRQVLLNLITNSIQAMEKGGTLIVRTSTERKGGKNYVKIEVTDTGGGIPPEIMPNIFNPFFTTKSTGTGLGLSTAKKIVELHGGFIECVNNYPVGVSFFVYLPLEEDEISEKA